MQHNTTQHSIVQHSIVKWLQLFRAQTAPATLLLLLTPYLANASMFELKTLVMAIVFVLIHYFSFGHNSLMDTAMLYDQQDPNKKHHPLINGTIKLARAHNIIHWGLSFLTVIMAMLTVLWSPNIGYAMICLMGWVSFGHAYNDGLSKESIIGFLAMSFSMTMMGGWGWFLSHENINLTGWIFVAYVFCTIIYQVSWSGFVKEMQVRERSNILTRMGARLDVNWKGEKEFVPNKARLYAWFVKGVNLIFGGLLLYLNFSLVRLVIFVLLACATLFYLRKATKKRLYNRGKELLNMSLMEILTIYIPVFLLLNIVEALLLISFGLIYFFGINKILWGKPYPRV